MEGRFWTSPNGTRTCVFFSSKSDRVDPETGAYICMFEGWNLWLLLVKCFVYSDMVITVIYWELQE